MRTAISANYLNSERYEETLQSIDKQQGLVLIRTYRVRKRQKTV